MKRTQELLIIDVWKPMDKEVVGAPELESIQETIAERFGTSVSPASIARALADHGVRLAHPEILQTDMNWRERNQLFAPEDLTFGTIDAANALIEKIESLRKQFEDNASMAERLLYEVRQFKAELDLLAANEKGPNRELAQEIAQWLTIWLQTPQIFSEWLSLRCATADFQARFTS